MPFEIFTESTSSTLPAMQHLVQRSRLLPTQLLRWLKSSLVFVFTLLLLRSLHVFVFDILPLPL
jgi:hypothetical protein